MQDEYGDPTPTLVRELTHVVDALGEISAGVEGLLTSWSTREFEVILDGVDAITANVWAALAALAVAPGETSPDVFPESWTTGA